MEGPVEAYTEMQLGGQHANGGVTSVAKGRNRVGLGEKSVMQI